LADTVEKVAKEMLRNQIAQQSNPAGRSLESRLRPSKLILNQSFSANPPKSFFNSIDPNQTLGSRRVYVSSSEVGL
jgi:hypothetical protein